MNNLLTKENILKMPAGWEMDALIAKEVTNLEKAKEGIWYWINGYLDECPYYSADIAAAFGALYKWLDNNKTYAVHIETVNIKAGRLHDVILWGMDEDETFDARHQDLAVAICRVLLLAVNHEV